MFAKRTNWDLTPNEFAKALAERRAAGLPIIDLTVSNPTECGFEYDTEAILNALRNPAAMKYEPNPKGLAVARQGVAGYYADRGDMVSIDDIFITTSTSEAYSWIFRLLCDPGDELLIPSPGYPLFDFLADINDVKLVRYPLFYDHGWHYDLHALEQAVTPRTRAVIVVHPNNPTGNYCKPHERARLNEICVAKGLALIADEVFLDFALDGQPRASFVNNGNLTLDESPPNGHAAPLTFTLSGLSKICGLPQMKVAWLVVSGGDALKRETVERLEIIGDTYLSPNAPVQLAVPALLAARHGFQQQVLSRLNSNLAAWSRETAADGEGQVLACEGGWCVVLRVPSGCSAVNYSATLLMGHGRAVLAGSFFGLSGHWFVVLLLGGGSDQITGFSDGLTV